MPDVEDSPLQDHANVLVMPPLLYLGALVFGVAAQWIVRWAVGALLLAGGIAVALAFARAFERSGQDKNPNTPTPAVISGGLYRYSRNPAYVSLTAVLLGLGLLLNNAWILLAAIPVLAILHFGVILREEAYLERTFGDEYLRYKAGVRRWL
ncbi:MAG: isoprenylcysteine carboxylmethyltransferase family protein [Deltaproteobacteria bacterium]|nr:isoprenylcysteine carboxylmethyltransferase family protein [Deltaproteobacteria bacterium]